VLIKRLSTETAPLPVFFRPPDGWVGDVIPFAHGGLVYLFYLHDRRDPERPGTAWGLYTTRDFVSYEYRGVALAHGSEDDQDLNAYTGSVVEDGGVFHLFYTGQNPTFRAPGRDEPAQVVMHATSRNGMSSWKKDPDRTIGASTDYDAGNWRDPYVFRPEPDGPWHMLISTRTKSGPIRRRGVIADLVSDDLESWRPATTPFWAPGRFFMHECPEVFSIGDWWYLVFSEFCDRFSTRYRMARTPFGPWTVPPHDTIDGRGLYAAKSVEHAGRRYFIGWIPTREDENDDGLWEWGGDLAVHEATQAPDGTLRFGMPTALRASFDSITTPDFSSVLGDWTTSCGALRGSAPDGYGLVTVEEAPDQFLLDVTVDLADGTTECGVVLRTTPDGGEGYMIRLEPRAGRMVFDRWPRKRTGTAQWQISGDVPQLIELERRVELKPGEHRLSVLVDGTACVAYLDDVVAMTARMYDRRGGGLGLFVGEGAAAFTQVSVAERLEAHEISRRGS
jgi:beta-fructofuranosidase